MKRRYLILGCSAFLLFGLSGCKKQIENQFPSDSVSSEALMNTSVGFEQALRGMYYQMTHAEHYIGGSDEAVSWVSTMDLLADNLILQQTGRGSQRSIANYQYFASSEIQTFAEVYSVIRAANIIIENKDNIAGTDNFYGEALAARAMCHFDLLRLYSEPVSGPQANLNGLGVPYLTSTDLSLKPSRGTVKETYDKVVADLTAALEVINADNGPGRLNRTAVWGLLSRVYLYGGEWQKCVDASTASLELQSDPGSMADFPNIWTDASSAGVIFKVIFTEQDRGSDGQIKVGVAYNQSLPGGIKSEWVVTKSLFDLYDSTDVRKSSYITQTTFSGADYNAIIKYAAKADGTTPGIVDVKYLRVAEVLLNRAEAYLYLSNEGGALADLNTLRANRYTGFVDGTETGAALSDAVMLERRLELAFESDRWFTLKRLGLPVVRDEFGDFADGTGTPAAVPGLAAGDHRWQLPLAQNDVQANENLEQNEGYN